MRRAEVRDVLAWLRLLVDPQDSAAVVRALARPPVELRQIDLARVIQVARRRKLDLVLGLTAATESPHVPPEARERIERFVELHRGASLELDQLAPDVFVGRLIERLGMPGRPLLAPEHAAQQRSSLARLRDLAGEFVRQRPRGSADELVRHLTGLVAEPAPGPAAQPAAAARAAELSAAHPDADEALLAGAGTEELEATLNVLREDLLASVARIGSRLGELRLDTDLDISHGVVRYLELLKVSALLQRPAEQTRAEAIADINARLLAAATPLQREILESSTLDDTLLGAADERARAQALALRGEHSLVPFLPRRGSGLALSASDIYTYRSCPLRYKFARVLRIPTEQTPNQRFGIVVHQVLERYHADGCGTLEQMLELLDAGWRRAGFDAERDREWLEKARAALIRYHARLHEQDAEPAWFERQFDFRLGPHHVRGRVDRVDRLSDGRYELIDYKTSRPKTAEQLRDDVQLSLYALAAREAWQLDSASEAYYYVLDDLKVPVSPDERDLAAVEQVVLEVGEGILAQAFAPTPSHAACSMCDYRIVCPAAEA
jgi:DNA helicase-2/ATP-dependent DNA helicase PcrA